MVSRNDEEAQSIGKIIDLHNKERKSVDKQITKAAIESVMNDSSFRERKSTVVFDPKWNKGVVAIVASRLVEAFYRPTIGFPPCGGILPPDHSAHRVQRAHHRFGEEHRRI